MEKTTPHILIVDDDPNLLSTMSDILKLKGFDPVVAQTGAAALEQINRQSFDLALLDLRLDDMSGLKVLRAIKARSPETECILLTGHASQNSAIEAIQMGVYGFFQKPFDMEQVLLSIQRAMEKGMARKALHESEVRYRELFEDSPVALREENFSEVKQYLDLLKKQGITDFQKYLTLHPEIVLECAAKVKIVDVNKAALKMFRAKSKNSMLINFTEILGSKAIEHFRDQLANIAEGQTEFSWEGIDHTVDGQQIDMEVNWIATAGYEEDLSKVIVSLQDITERKHAEEAVLESEERFRVIFEKANDAIHIENADDKILAVNSRMCELMGYSREELLNMHVTDLQAPEMRQQGNVLKNEFARHGTTIFETLNLHRDGRRIPVEISIGTIELPGGELYISVVRDITERKQAEEALRNSEKRFRALIENGRDNISLVTADGTLLWESPSTTSLMGYLPDQFVGLNLFELLHPEDRDQIQGLLTQLIQKPDESQDGSFRLRHSDGSWRWIEATAANLLSEPSVRAVVINYRDVTARKLAEEKVAQTEKRSQSLVENAPDGIVLIGADGNYKYASPAALRIFGYNSEDISHNPANDTHPEDLPMVLQVLQDLIENPSKVPTIQYRFLHKDGSWRWVESTFTNLLAEPSVEALVINFRDITEQKQAEDKIRILSRALEQSPTSIVITDLAGNIEYVNPKFSEVTGYSLEEAIGENPRILKSNNTTEAEYKKLWNTITSGNIWQGEFLNTKKNGEAYWENAIITPVFNDDGNISNYLAIKEDITEHKRAQEAQKQSELQFRALFELSPDAVVLVDPYDPNVSWPIVDCNSEACRINGYSRDELIGQSIDIINTTVGTPSERNAYMKQIQEKGNLKLETFHRHKNGMTFPVETSTSMINVGSRELIIGIDRDITERKLAQEAQKQSELQFRALFELSPDAVMLIDPYHPDIAWPIIDCNPAACQMNGYRRDELIGQSIDIVTLEPATLSNRNASIEQIRDSGNNLKFETFHRHKNGVVFPIEVSTSLVKVGDRELIIGIDRDITERKRAENELRQSEQRFNQLANNIQEAFWITEAASGREIYVSPAAEKIWGIPVKDLYQSRYLFLESILQEDRQIAMDALERQSRGAKTEMEYRIQHPDGSVHWIWDRAFPVFDETNKVLLITGLTADITQRKLAEIEIKERTEELELINVLNEAVNRGDRLDKVMGLFAGELRKISACRDSSIYLLSPDGKYLIVKNLSIDPAILKKIEKLTGKPLSEIRIPIREDSNFQKALQSEQGVIMTDPKSIQERILEIIGTSNLPAPIHATIRKFIPQLYRLLDIGSAMVFPLVSGKKVIGLLDVSSREIFTEKDLKRVQKISSQLTAVILREQANGALLESEERYRSIFDGVQDAIFIESKDGRILGVNNRACEMYGYNRDEFIQKTVADLVPQGSKFFIVPSTQPNISPVPFETINRRANGDLFPVEVSGRLQTINGEEILLVIIRDITERKRAEKGLLQSEKRFRSLFENMLNGFAYCQMLFDGERPQDFIYLDVNRAFETLTGLKDVIGKKASEAIPGIRESDPELIEMYGRVVATGIPETFEAYVEAMKMWFSISVYSPQKEYFVAVFDVITERKQAEIALVESQRRLTTLMASLPGMAFRCKNDPEWTMDFVSEGCYSLTGYQPAELINSTSLTYGQIIHSEDREMTWDVIQANLEKKQPYQLNYRIITASGKERWVWEQGQGVYDPAGNLLALEGFIEDVTERKRAEDALKESEALYRQAIEVTGAVPYLQSYGDNNGVYIHYDFIGEGIRQITGYRPDEFDGTVWDSLAQESVLLGDLANYSMEEAVQRVRTGKTSLWKCEHRIRARDGKIRWIFEAAVELYAENGIAKGSIGMFQDITERKQADLALAHERNLLRTLIDILPDRIYVKDTEARYLLKNLAGAHSIGTSPDELVGKSDSDYYPPDLAARYYADDQSVIQSGRPLINHEEPGTDANNSLRWISTTKVPWRDNEGRIIGLVGIGHDITEHKQEEENIRQRVKALELLYESGLAFSQLLNPKEIAQKIIELLGEKLDWHHTAIRLIRAQDELELVAFDQPGLEDNSEAQAVETRFNKLITRVGEGLSGWALQQSRTVRVGDVSSDPHYVATYPGLHSGLYVPLKSSNHILGVISIESEKPNAFNEADEQLLTTLANQAANAFENARLFQTARQEIIERKRIESLLADERNQLAQRVEERTADLSRVNADLANAVKVKDEFLASMSHELRTPLTGILGLSEVLQLKIYGDLNDKQVTTLKTIEESGRHLLDLINDILDLSKIEAGRLDLQFAPYSLADICQASLQLTKGMAQHKHQQVQYAPPQGVIIVQVDARRLKQALVNLISNAIKFTPEGGEIGLEVEANQTEGKIRLTVWDKGIGIKTEDLDKLFKPFTQLDSGLAREYSGSGLGLSLVKHLVEMHNGGIEVESSFGQGSRFTIILPWSPQNTTPIPYTMQRGNTGSLNSLALPPHTKLPLVMYVDDNEMVLQMVADFLEAKQYRVVKVRNGLELLERAAEYHPNIMLVDIQMPGIGGMETIRRIRAHSDPYVAAAPVIAVTALAMPADRERCLLAGANEYMSKPLKLKELAAVIQRLLERK